MRAGRVRPLPAAHGRVLSVGGVELSTPPEGVELAVHHLGFARIPGMDVRYAGRHDNRLARLCGEFFPAEHVPGRTGHDLERFGPIRVHMLEDVRRRPGRAVHFQHPAGAVGFGRAFDDEGAGLGAQARGGRPTFKYPFAPGQRPESYRTAVTV